MSPRRFLEGDGRRVDNLFRSPAVAAPAPCRHGRSHADFGLATADRPGNGGHAWPRARTAAATSSPSTMASSPRAPVPQPPKETRRATPRPPRRGAATTAHGTVVLHDRQRTGHRHADGPARKRLTGSDAPGQTESPSPGTRPASMSLFPGKPSVIDAFMISQLPSTAARIVSRSTPLRRAS